jgi:hypothetical protein
MIQRRMPITSTQVIQFMDHGFIQAIETNDKMTFTY